MTDIPNLGGSPRDPEPRGDGRSEAGVEKNVSNMAIAPAPTCGEEYPLDRESRDFRRHECMVANHPVTVEGEDDGIHFVDREARRRRFRYRRGGCDTGERETVDFPEDRTASVWRFRTRDIGTGHGVTIAPCPAPRKALRLHEREKARIVTRYPTRRRDIISSGTEDVRMLTGREIPEDIIGLRHDPGAGADIPTPGPKGRRFPGTPRRRSSVIPVETWDTTETGGRSNGNIPVTRICGTEMRDWRPTPRIAMRQRPPPATARAHLFHRSRHSNRKRIS